MKVAESCKVQSNASFRKIPWVGAAHEGCLCDNLY